MRKRIHLLPVGILLLAGFMIGIFLDLDVSKALFSKNNTFGLLFASIGELPMYGGVALAGGLLVSSVHRMKKSKLALAISILIAAGATGFGIFFQGRAFCSVNAWGSLYVNLQTNMVAAILIGIALVLPWLIVGLVAVKDENSGDTYWAAVEILLVGFLQIGLITVLKGVFHRPRFRSLTESGAEFQQVFTRYKEYAQYITDTVTKEEFKSFPSGHTGSGAMCFVLGACLPYICRKVKITKQQIFFYIGALFMFVLAFSRIVVGAHYLTDVCFGGFVTLLLFAVVDTVLGKIRQKKSSKMN